jgi:hypothetical protein
MDILNVNTVKKVFPYHGPVQSEDFNELLEQVVLDLTTITSALNNEVQPLIESLPQGSRTITAADRDGEVNPIANGMDGSQIYLDMTNTDVNNPLLWNQLLGRPNTIKEALEYLLFRVEQLSQDN